MGRRPRGVRAPFPRRRLRLRLPSPPAAEVGVAAAAGEDASSAAGDVFSDARAAVEALYDTKVTFFTADPEEKESRLQNESYSALQLLDSIPPGCFLSCIS